MKRLLMVLTLAAYTFVVYMGTLYTTGYRMEARGWDNGYHACLKKAAKLGFGVWQPAGEKDGIPMCKFRWAEPRLDPIPR